MSVKDRDMWNSFVKTGRVADYLRYRGVDVFRSCAEKHSPYGRGEACKHDNRRPDNKGE